MKLTELIEVLHAKVRNMSDDRELQTGYAGDFLSFVMGKAPQDSAWFTVMNNINIMAVATLAEVGVIVVCEGVHVDDTLLARAQTQGINVIETDLDIFSAIKAATREGL